MDSLSGKIALVTGGARRIGKEITLALADEGMDVVIHYRSSYREAKKLLAQIEKKGRSAWVIKGDLSRPEKCSEIVDFAIEKAGGLHVLVNNAGVYPPSEFKTLSMKDIEKSMNVNAWSPLFLMKRFSEKVKKGCIVNITDALIAGKSKGRFAYLLSKNSLAFITKILALELAPRIRVNAVAPGPILPPPQKDELYLKKVSQRLPLKKHGTPQDIVEAVIFLLKSDFVTGEIIYVDGGGHLLFS